MTTIVKFNLSISVAVIILSVASISLLHKIKNPESESSNKQTDTSTRIAVLNGCGRAGLAALCAEKLRSEGFDVVNGLGGNADSYDFNVSVVVDRKGDFEKAQIVGKKIGISDILDQRSDNPYIIEDVVVILGRDWDTLKLFNEETKE
ncbi:MAG: LytR C-terminal domain-containing protein [Candidatus Latescibacteria bacterium]|nr:LytR C-terminal domain-containing protein [Candidatus Latescibacterota bacterium]